MKTAIYIEDGIVQLVLTPESKWKWFGNVGHFICGRWCRFHLTTQVGGYLVSTIGEYVHPRNSGSNERTEQDWLENNPLGENVGCDRKFETMVFKAGKPCSSKECGCGLPAIDGSEIDFIPANTRKDARAAHMKLCVKYAKMGAPK